MSTRIETLRRGFAAFAERDADTLESLLTPDVDIRLASPARAGKPVLMRRSHYVGHAGYRDWLREIDEDYSNLALEAREFEEIGELIVVLGTLVYECGDVGGGMTIGWVVRFAGDLVSRIDVYWDWEEARAASRAGRPELSGA